MLELRRRGDGDFLITLDGRVLMTSAAHRSEAALAELACAGLGRRRSIRVLIGGLGMGFTLRAALEILPERAQVVVAELHPVVVEWCRGPLAPLTGDALSDPRVTVELGDVAGLIGAAPAGSAHAILLDLFIGPRRPPRDDPHFGVGALERARAALAPGGVLAVWSEQTDTAFQRRLEVAGFQVEHRRPGRGGLRHAVYLAVRAPDTPGDPPRGRGRRRRSSGR